MVAISDLEQTALVGECKWSNHPVGVDVFEALQHKTRQMLGNTGWQVGYVLFSKVGFTPALEAQAVEENLQWVQVQQFFE